MTRSISGRVLVRSRGNVNVGPARLYSHDASFGWSSISMYWWIRVQSVFGKVYENGADVVILLVR